MKLVASLFEAWHIGAGMSQNAQYSAKLSGAFLRAVKTVQLQRFQKQHISTVDLKPASTNSQTATFADLNQGVYSSRNT